MKIIISPAKSLNLEKDLPTSNFSIPVFLDDSKIINQNLKKKNRLIEQRLKRHACSLNLLTNAKTTKKLSATTFN